jgi:RNA polymerase sigma-70 factor, ECF subfamily
VDGGIRAEARTRWGLSQLTPMPETPPPSQGAEDLRLLAAIAQGDRDALGQLYDRFSRPLFSIAVRILSDSREAEDVVHDAFVTLWEKAPEFEATKGSAFGWAVTLTRNRAIDRVRQRRRRQELLAESVPSDLGYADDLPSSADLPDGMVFQEQAAAVRKAVASLPHDQQHALELAFFSGLTQQEIAAKLQQPLGTIKARIRRGLLKLRDVLSPEVST